MDRQTFTVSVESPKSREAIALLERLDQELARRYPTERLPSGIDSGDTDPRGRFIVARADTRAIGCAALRIARDGTAEVKRLFVEPSFRGQGIARAMLRMIETEARKLEVSVLKIEIGTKQPEAVQLFESAGYTPTENFGEYKNDPLSRCFQKRIANL